MRSIVPSHSIMQENPYAAPTAEPSAEVVAREEREGPVDWTIGGILAHGFQAVKEQPVALVGGMLLVMVIQYAVQGLSQVLLMKDAMESGGTTEVSAGISFLLPILSMVVSVYFLIGTSRAALAAARGEVVEIGMYFSGYDRLLAGLGLSVLMYVAILAGFLLLIVPGIIATLGLSLAFFNLADSDMPVVTALTESWERTKGHKFHIFLFGLAALGLIFVGILALVVGVFVVYPVLFVAGAEMYRCITGRH